MDFYDEIKKSWKNNIDLKTGLTHDQKEQLDILIGLLKGIALEKTALGETSLSHDFDSEGRGTYTLNKKSINKEESKQVYACQLYKLLTGTKEEVVLKELARAFGLQFKIKTSVQRLYRSLNLTISVSWPAPKEEGF